MKVLLHSLRVHSASTEMSSGESVCTSPGLPPGPAEILGSTAAIGLVLVSVPATEIHVHNIHD